MDNNNERQLESILRACKRPVLGENSKLLMKRSIMEKIDQPMVVSIKGIVSEFVLDLTKRTLIKERVFSSIEKNVLSKFTWSNFFIFNKRLLSSSLLIMMIFSFAAFVNVDMNVVRAQSFTTLDSFDGNVVVERGGVPLNIEVGMQIYEDDRIATGADSGATIRFFDDSITRLSGDTTIGIDSLVRPDNSSVRSYVEIDLNRGTLWGNVLSLDQTDSSFVVDASVAKLTAQKASFNVSVNSGEVSVGVFGNEVSLYSNEKDDKVLSGEKVVLKPSERSVIVEKIGDVERDLAWVKDNLNDDKQYVIDVEKRLLAAKAESVGFVQGDELSENTSLRENTVLFLTFNDVKKKKLELDLAEKRFVAAQVKFASEEVGEKGKSLFPEEKVVEAASNFSKKALEFEHLVENVETTDEKYAGELKLYLDDKMLANKKDLAVSVHDVVDPVVVQVLVEKVIVPVAIAAPIAKPPVLRAINWDAKVPVALEEENKIDVDSKTYGVGLKGDKPLSPLFNLE